MSESPAKTTNSRNSMRLFWVLSVPAYIADQVTKLWIVKNLEPYQDRIEVAQGIFWIDHVKNTGVAFGMANGGRYSNLIFGFIAFVACSLIAWMWKKEQFPTVAGRVSAALLISGALGNLTDRFLHNYVVDWLTVDLKFMMWPSFNLADAFICVAAVLLLVTSFLPEPKDEESAS